MKTFRKTYRMEVLIKAETAEKAEEIYRGMNLNNLEFEVSEGIILEGGLVESYEIEEEI